MWHALAFFPTAYVSGSCWPDSTNRWQLRYERVRAALVDVQVELQEELYRRCMHSMGGESVVQEELYRRCMHSMGGESVVIRAQTQSRCTE